MRLALPDNLALRPVCDADAVTLLAIYASTREDELARTDWGPDQKAAFVAMQFQAQTAHYRANYPGAEFHLVEVDGEAAGRLYLHRREGGLRIMDIALLPAFRGRGIGGAILRALQAEAAAAGSGLSIHVEVFNPARRLYERLGFRPAAEAGVYILMEWSAASRSAPDPEKTHEHV